MKITKSKLKQIIQEELEKLTEAYRTHPKDLESLKRWGDWKSNQPPQEPEAEMELEAGEDSSTTLAKLSTALEDIGALSPMIQNLLDKLRGRA